MTTQEAWSSYQQTLSELESAEDSWREVARLYSQASRNVDHCRESAVLALAKYRALQEEPRQRAVA